MTTIHYLPSPTLDPVPVVVELGNARPESAPVAAPVEPTVRIKRKYTRRVKPQIEEQKHDGE